MVGLERGTVELEEYDESWRKKFEEEEERLKSELGKVKIKHVGSTAVEGLIAKPIIDIVIAVEDIESEDRWIESLERVGYSFRAKDEVEDRLFFAKGPEENRKYYLSITEKGSKTYEELILFRDFLRENPAKAEEYSQLKKKLADKYPQNRSKYTESKSEFIQSAVQKARTAS